MPLAIVTLTTDFGTGGPYVGAMKGVILGINPAAQLVDIAHEIEPQNVREAAFCIAHSAPYFPRGTIHTVVVDPGGGTSRRLLCVAMHEQFFLSPPTWLRRLGASSCDPKTVSSTVVPAKVVRATPELRSRLWVS